MRPSSTLDGFFCDDVDAVASAVRALPSQSGGAVTSAEPYRDAALTIVEPHGIFSEQIFGAPGPKTARFGHIEIPGAVHPLLFPAIAQSLDMTSASFVRALVRGGDEGYDFSDDERPRPGYQLIEERLRARGAALEVIEASIVRRIPVTPLIDRPLTTADAIGPINEAWIELVERAQRHHRLLDLDAPLIILAGEALQVQLALERVVTLTRERAERHMSSAMRTPYPFTRRRVRG